jgi:signal transduction histidine kinase
VKFLLLICVFLICSLHTLAQQEVIDSLLQKALDYRYQSVDSALHFARLAENMATKSGLLERNRPTIAINRAGTNYVAGRYVAAMNDYKEAYSLLESTSDRKIELIRTINGLGLIEHAQSNYTKAIAYWNTCLQLSHEIQDTTNIIRSKFNLALGLSDIKNYPLAIEELQGTIYLASLVEDHTHGTMAKNRLAYNYYQMNALDKAAELYLEILRAEKQANNWELAFAHTGLAEVYASQQRWTLALQQGKIGFEKAKIVGAFWDKKRASAVLTTIYEALEDYPQALNYAKFNKQMGDSLYSKEKATEINFLKLQLADSENMKLSQEKAAIQQQNDLYGIITAILITFVAFFAIGTWVIIRNSKQKEHLNQTLEAVNQLLEEQKTQIESQNQSLSEINEAKNKLFSILSHDLRAPLNSMKQFMEMDIQGVFSKAEQETIKTTMYLQVHQTDRLLNNLLNWSKTQLEGIHTTPTAVALEEEMTELLKNFEFPLQMKKITLKHAVQKLPLIQVDINQLRIILQNIFHNALKFSPIESSIEITYSQAHEYIAIHIRDFGAGINEAKRLMLESILETTTSTLGTANEAGSGLGLFLVKQFLSLNHATLHVASELGHGTTFTIRFRLAILPTITHQNTASDTLASHNSQV